MSKILGWFFLIVMMLAGDSIVMARPNIVVIMTDDQDDNGINYNYARGTRTREEWSDVQ